MPEKKLPLPMRPDGPMGRPFAMLMERMNAPAYEAVLSALQPGPGDALLEIGFGTGDFLRRAARRMKHGRLAGVDPAPLMVEMATRRLRSLAPRFTLELREADAGTLDWPPASFNAVAAIHSFQFWNDPEASLRTIRTLLKPGGKLCLSLRQHGATPPDWLPNPLSKAPDETARLIALLGACGFIAPHQVEAEPRAVLVMAGA
ncbi:MAG: class I SAM-dependent methyltransferase [Hyphomonas sp.]